MFLYSRLDMQKEKVKFAMQQTFTTEVQPPQLVVPIIFLPNICMMDGS